MATQKVYLAGGTPVTFKDSGGTVVLSLVNLQAAAGRISAQWDRGAGALPGRYRMRCVFPLQAAHTAVLGEQIEVYLATSDGTDVDGTVGVADAALTTEKRRNLAYVGSVVVDVVAGDAKLTATFTVELFERYVSVGVWNATTDDLQNDANASCITLTPYPDDIQAAA
jgi:hypothetical protein